MADKRIKKVSCERFYDGKYIIRFNFYNEALKPIGYMSANDESVLILSKLFEELIEITKGNDEKRNSGNRKAKNNKKSS